MGADHLALAERVRSVLLQTALAAYEDAAIRGLCAEGAWEAAVSALRQVDLGELAPRSRDDRAATGCPNRGPEAP